MPEVHPNQNRTAIVYFDPQQEGYLKLTEILHQSQQGLVKRTKS